MDSGRIPACDIVPLAGDHIASGCEVLIGRNSNDYYPSMQESHIKKGNRCDHDKNKFKRPSVFDNAKRRPHCLEEAKRRIYESINDNFRYPQFAGLLFHKAGSADQNGSVRDESRKRRSERIEGIFSLTLPLLLHNLNIHKMACGFYDQNNNFHPQDYSYIESKTDQSSVRVKREMAVLQSEGIIKVNTQRELTNDGVWRTKSVEIEFTDKIFEILELIPEFLNDRETSYKMFHEKQSRLDKNQAKRDIYRKSSFSPDKNRNKANLKPSLSSGLRGCVKPVPAAQKGRGAAIKERMQQLQYQGHTPTQIFDLLKKEFPPPH